MSKHRSLSSKDTAIIVTSVIGVIGTITVAYFAYRGTTAPLEIAISATQTAESNKIVVPVVITNIVQDTPTKIALFPTSVSTQILSTSTQAVPEISYSAPSLDNVSTFPSLMGGNFYQNPSMPSSVSYHINVSMRLSYIWRFNWCALNGNYLGNNLSQISLKFLIEDFGIPSQGMYEYRTSESGWECHFWATLLNG